VKEETKEDPKPKPKIRKGPDFEDPKPAPKPIKENEESIDPLTSSPDDSEEEDEFKDCQDQVLAQYDKTIPRTKDKFKGTLKDVIISIRGREFVFKQVQLELNY
jgi:hypothetical protein